MALEIVDAIEHPVSTGEPTFDDRVGSDDGDGPFSNPHLGWYETCAPRQ